MRIIIAIVAALIATAIAAVIAGNARWRRQTTVVVEQLDATDPARALTAAIDTVPPPAARYLRRAIAEPSHRVRSAIATQQAEFFINGAWRPLTATQYFTTDPPGFVWDARIAMAPLLPAQVRDAYVSGRGSMQASFLGLYSIVDLAGTRELNSGALQRFLGEAVWFPTALMPSSTVTWSPHDDRSATVTLTDNGASVSLRFEFNANDDVIRISGDRFKETNGAYVVQPWVIQCSEHVERSGMRIPEACAVAWIGANGEEPYWRGRIASIDYTFWP